MNIKKVIPQTLIISQVFGLYGGVFQIPRVLAIILLPIFFLSVKKILLNQKEVFWYFFCSFLYCCLSMLFLKLNGEDSLKETFYTLVNFTIFIQIVNFGLSLSVNKIIKSWVILVLITIPIALIEITYNIHFSNSKFGDETMIGGIGVLKKYAAITYGNYNLYNHIIAISFPFILAGIRLIKNIIVKIFYIFFIVCIFYIVLINGSRGTILCLIISLLIFIFFYSSPKRNYRILYTFSTFLILLGFLNYFLTNDTFFYFRSRIQEKGINDSSRMDMIQLGVEMLIDSKFFGIGAGNFMNYAKEHSNNNILVPHNVFMEVLSQYGLIVFLLFLMLIYKVLIKPLLLGVSNGVIKYILISSIVIMPIAFTINSVYLSNPYMWIWFASLLTLTVKNKNYAN